MEELIKKILNEYKQSGKTNSNLNPIRSVLMNDIPNEINDWLDKASYSELEAEGYMGQGNKSKIPLIRITDKRITKTAQRGLYIVYLFKADMSGLYLTLNQGVNYFKENYKPNHNKKAEMVSNFLREKIHDSYFSIEPIELGSNSDKEYAATTIISKYYEKGALPNDDILKQDLLRLCDIYNSICESVAQTTYEKMVGNIISDLEKDLDSLPEFSSNDKENTEKKAVIGYNRIYYGMPGCGKSYRVKELTKNISDDKIFRVTFYQDYSYSDFIGQIMPVTKIDPATKDRVLSYDFVAGPFTKAIKKALEDKNKNVYLIIEEINRGNAPSIFGDVFQLLDRDDDEDSKTYGQSEYAITNDLVAEYLGITNCKLFIPSNLIILATMNTSDQNVFTLDTAFKRRWQLEEVRNKFDNHPYGNKFVPGTDKTWKAFVNGINKAITSLQLVYNSSEDKRIGAYFVKKNDLCDSANEDNKEIAKKFSYKVLEYLWDDVVKYNRAAIFDPKYETLSDLIDGFLDLSIGLKIFNSEITF